MLMYIYISRYASDLNQKLTIAEIEDIPNGSGKVSVKVKPYLHKYYEHLKANQYLYLDKIPMTPKEFCEDLDIPDFSVDKWCLRNQVLLIYNDE
ncbi:uncharacterized protein LOC113553303 isoform X4 [Rhopalosiphum maidis]|uniref:uncharacterized protein LOC113553303 isoform X4 n=1 Tax=Rhopalosiphum maidis TaxID=43146 RepID=UPI000F00CD0B|nr:uncharacterized protein LOC113553303 isoform X4 [Rhopalosiphum maidis]